MIDDVTFKTVLVLFCLVIGIGAFSFLIVDRALDFKEQELDLSVPVVTEHNLSCPVSVVNVSCPGLVVRDGVANPMVFNVRESEQCRGKSFVSLTARTGEGSSMMPRLYDFHTYFTTPFDDSRVVVEGDIVCFDHPDAGVICHQVVGVYSDVVRVAPINQFYDGGVFLTDEFSPSYDDIRYVVCGVLFS